MKITKAEKKSFDLEKMEKDYNLAIGVWVDKKDDSKQGIIIDPNIKGEVLMHCCQRLNRVMAQMMDISYPEFLKILKNCYVFDERTKNLELTDEQLKKMIDKDIRG
jgi:uncharacterized metal-binding protein YceD (DUF177 family)